MEIGSHPEVYFNGTGDTIIKFIPPRQLVEGKTQPVKWFFGRPLSYYYEQFPSSGIPELESI